MNTYPFRKKEVDVEEVKRLYYDERLTAREVGERLGTNRVKIQRMLHHYGCQMRPACAEKKPKLIITEKKCHECLKTKPVTQFFRNCQTRDGYQIYCKTCDQYRRNKTRLKYFYKISPEEVQQLSDYQGGKCKICHKPLVIKSSSPRDSLQIDHDHKSKEVRGLLCGACNMGLGCFKDRLDLLETAIEYLKDPPYPRMKREEE